MHIRILEGVALAAALDIDNPEYVEVSDEVYFEAVARLPCYAKIVSGIITLGESVPPEKIPVEEATEIPEQYPIQTTLDERTAILEQENTTLKAQLTATVERQEFLEDCIAEIAVAAYGL